MHSATDGGAKSRWKTGLSAAILIGAVCAVLGQVCSFEFLIWDDPQTVSQNPLLNPPSIAHTAELWVKPIESLYIPVTYSVWAGVASLAWLDAPDAQGHQLNPYLFHSLNLALHLISVLIIWRLLFRLVQNEWAALAGALVFALHPVQVETIAWVSGMKDLLYALLSLLAAVTAIKMFEAQKRPRRIGLYALATLLFALAFLAKPTAMAFPLLVVALAWEQKFRWRRGDIAATASWFALAAVEAVVTRLVQTGSNAGISPPIWFRPFAALDAIAFYLIKLVAPFSLAPDYGRSPAWLRANGSWKFTWILPVLVGVVLLVIRAPRRIWLAGLLFLIPLLPILGLVTFNFQFYSTVADHYLYLPMLGVALLVAHVLERLSVSASAPSPRRYGIGAAAVLGILILGAVSIVQAGYWQNSRRLFAHTLAVNSASFISHYDLGVLHETEQAPQAAIEEFRSAIALRTNYVPAHAEFGMLLLRNGRTDEGLAELSESLRLTAEQEPNENLSQAYVNIAQIALKAGRPQQARRLADEGLQRYPTNASLRQILRPTSTSHP